MNAGNSQLPASPVVTESQATTTPESGVVQINLSATTGQIVTGAEFGFATDMGGWNSTDYSIYQDPAFQKVADQYPIDLLRHNWNQTTMMDQIFPNRSSITSPNWSYIDNYIHAQGGLTGWFNNNTGTQIITVGYPSWMDLSNSPDQQLLGQLFVQVANHFAAMGEPVYAFELVNEPGPGGSYSITDLANTFNAVAEALKAANPGYKLGGLDEMWMDQSDMQQFLSMTAPNVGFVAWHQYITNGSDGKTAQQDVTDGMQQIMTDVQAARQIMDATSVPQSVPIFLGEYNVDGTNYFDPNNTNMVGAVAAAAVTYGMIASKANATMAAVWDVVNNSYAQFGSQGAYGATPVAVVLSDLAQYMPGTLAQMTMPSDTPGLVGYTTEYNGGFSVALIDTNLSQGYTVDLSKDALPTSALYRVEVSNANPMGIKQSIANLSQVYVPAGSVVIVTNEAPHGGREYTGSGGGGGGGIDPTTYITPGDGSFTDAAGNVYTTDSAGNAQENGTPIPGGSNTGAMELYQGVVYAQNATSENWSTWNQSTWTPSSAPPELSPTVRIGTTGQPVTTISGTQVQNQTDYGTTIDITAPGVAEAVLGSASDTLRFLHMAQLNVTAGSAASTVVADAGNNTFFAGAGELHVSGGSGADSYIFHAGDATLSISDFSLTKGDTLTVDQSLAGSMSEHATSNGRLNITFSNNPGHIHLAGITALPTRDIHFA